MREKKNVPPEISWRQLRHRFTPGFENILDHGVNNGWYDPNVLLEALVFRWVFIPWLQKELDAYRERVNNTKKRADRNKVLPIGVPNDMFEHPEDYGVLDFKIKVRKENIDRVREIWAPRDHEVFQLVPPSFAVIIARMYEEINKPEITRQNCWDVYLALLAKFHALDAVQGIPENVDECWGRALTLAREDCASDIELMPNLQPLANDDDAIGDQGGFYMGGVNNGKGLDTQQLAQLDEMLNNDEPQVVDNDRNEGVFAWFSDDEQEEDATADDW
ncbi:hypothetical protein R3P38DRAFT_2805351 [Favolaschia claudopus]|uniref:Uncharacterized protein n=1 Tax=Favolaschia claudopus TaxID=2862362 RepID=A0AAV9ZMS5_9AGAR